MAACLRDVVSKDTSRGCATKPHDARFPCTSILLDDVDRAGKRKRCILDSFCRRRRRRRLFVTYAHPIQAEPSLNPSELLDGILVSKSDAAVAFN